MDIRKTALITGGSRGIGKAIAIRLAEKGNNIVFSYVSNEEAAQKTLEEIKSKGVKVLAFKADVSSYDECQKLIDTTVKEMGSIDILVNNAGIIRDNLIMRMKEEEFDEVIRVNLKGVFNCIKHVSKIMLKQKSGRIINISSIIGLIGNIGQINYAAAKAGLHGITKSAAKELASRGITVNAIAPGFIESDMTNTLADKYKEAIIKAIPLGRIGKAKEVADLVCFLASEEASYITGQIICVDGGMAMGSI
ncbi:MAG TPA: 3-oxoacyl-[acyl-carrier-protein] reductase [Defluviitaleaceae bacterium]|jgi:3-oxoacyl-[acyl-carrier protein] reductase|nr:3-oxoacyl-[acyl-carrier-protein] reductase [Candidatus Epulonipiscium sp.]HOQ16591.1 3-oxoacyl-[acyl-carrier-protein] reductase [Defluviitaleaceae bacterium]HQD49545.1 3-oxoacyl-[acyl-carrier-protein] reductase [Defluviitaleaceae bacterium]